MTDKVEEMAEAIHKERPVTFEGIALNWEHVVRSHPERAAEYRDAARNQLRAAEAMKKMDGEAEARQGAKP